MVARRRRPVLTIGWLTAAAVAIALAFVVGRGAIRLATAAELARASQPNRQAPAGPTLRLLVAGDSTAVGTGASEPGRSLAGLIGRDHPRLRIDNLARDGATLADLPAQLGAAPGVRYDLVLVQAGGNDVMRLRDLDAARGELDRVLALAHALAPQVILMPAGNVGNAPFFVPPLSWWMTARSRTLHRHAREAAARHGTVYVDLFRARADDPFVQRPGLHAADGLHPSDAGYAVWRQALARQADLPAWLAAARAP